MCREYCCKCFDCFNTECGRSSVEDFRKLLNNPKIITLIVMLNEHTSKVYFVVSFPCNILSVCLICISSICTSIDKRAPIDFKDIKKKMLDIKTLSYCTLANSTGSMIAITIFVGLKAWMFGITIGAFVLAILGLCFTNNGADNEDNDGRLEALLKLFFISEDDIPKLLQKSSRRLTSMTEIIISEDDIPENKVSDHRKSLSTGKNMLFKAAGNNRKNLTVNVIILISILIGIIGGYLSEWILNPTILVECTHKGNVTCISQALEMNDFCCVARSLKYEATAAVGILAGEFFVVWKFLRYLILFTFAIAKDNTQYQVATNAKQLIHSPTLEKKTLEK